MNIQSLIELMQNTAPLVVQGVLFLFCMSSIVFFTRFYGKTGLYIYSVIMVIIANIQVLKATKMAAFIHPVPLGNVVFTSLFLASDIITELYGKKSAERGIWLGFLSYLIFSIIMILTVGIKPLEYSNPDYKAFWDAHNSMALLFTPTLPLLISSLAAYFISLWIDVMIFAPLKQIWGESLLGFRAFVSTLIGIVVDNIIFSMLAWVVFAIMPISFETVLNTYIIGTLKIRIILTIASIPVFYLVKNMVKKYKLSE